MSDLLAGLRLSMRFRGGENVRHGACYGVVVSFVSMLVFCVLVATVSVWKAFVFAGLVLVSFGVVECLKQRGGTGDEQVARAGIPPAACQLGLAKSVVDTLPTFAYASNGVEGGHDLESGSSKLCSVCLEDLEDGEMVRQLPTCKHLFHVDCIDMWLHSHSTCPVCRCDLSPPRTTIAKVAELPAADALPPV
jgi:hypothetical protein